MNVGMALVGRAFLVVAAMAWALLGSKTAQAGDGAAVEALGVADADDDSVGGFDRLRKPPIPVSFLSTDGGWIQFQYPPSARERVGPLIAEADELRAELADILGQAPLDGVEVRIARGPEEMTTLAPWGAVVPPGSGISYPKLRLMVLSLSGASEPNEVGVAFRRELARMALSHAVSGHALPPWLVEGFATHFSRDATWSRSLRLYRLVVRRRTDTTAELDALLDPARSEQVAVAESADLVGFLIGPDKRSRFAVSVAELRRGEGIEAAVRVGYGSNLALLERKWGSDLGRRATLATLYAFAGLAGALLLGGGLIRVLRRRRSRPRRATGSGRPAVSSDRTRVHIVFSRRDDRIEPPIVPEAEIPKVEHEGEWHTLH
jgi:hypothetical protein